MRFKKIYIITFFTLFLLNLLLVNPVLAGPAGTYGEVISGFTNTGVAIGFPNEDGKPQQEFGAAWMNYINGMFGAMGFLFMVMIIYGGWLWMTAKGNEEEVTKAKHIMTNSLIALGIIIGARLIVEVTLRILATTFPGAS